MSKNKRTIILCLSTLLLILSMTLVSVFMFMNSVLYATYDLTLAQKYNDTEKALSYFDIQKLVDNAVERATKEIYADGDVFTAVIGSNMIESLKSSLPIKYKNDIINMYESKDEKLSTLSDFEIFTIVCSKKPVSAETLTYKKLSKNSVEQSFCNKNHKGCFIYKWQKINKKWVISDLTTTE